MNALQMANNVNFIWDNNTKLTRTFGLGNLSEKRNAMAHCMQGTPQLKITAKTKVHIRDEILFEQEC